MVESEARLKFLYCGTPCGTACPVHRLPLEQRVTVERVFEQHWPQLEQSRETGQPIAQDEVENWATNALGVPSFSPNIPPEAKLVAEAAIKINKGDCPNYKPV